MEQPQQTPDKPDIINEASQAESQEELTVNREKMCEGDSPCNYICKSVCVESVSFYNLYYVVFIVFVLFLLKQIFYYLESIISNLHSIRSTLNNITMICNKSMNLLYFLQETIDNKAEKKPQDKTESKTEIRTEHKTEKKENTEQKEEDMNLKKMVQIIENLESMFRV
jgi:hypothetical protein